MTTSVASSTVAETIRRAASALLDYPFRCWFYGDSIAFEGLLAASEATSDSRFRSFAHGFVRSWAARREPYRELDNTAPGYAICRLYETTGDELLLEAAVGLAAFLRTRRLLEGVFVSFERPPLHPPYGGGALTPLDTELIAEPGPGVFVDPLHFDPPFFAALARLTGDESLTLLAIEQALSYTRLLQDRSSGLFAHFWLATTGRAYGHGWARGSGWALAGLVDLLGLVPDGVPGRAELLDSLRLVVAGLARTQRPDGHWHAVADDPASGVESSTAAFVAASLLKAGADGTLRDAETAAVAKRAFTATRDFVAEDGLLPGVSRCVWPCTVPSHYRCVPRGELEPWGQGPLLLALARADEAAEAP